MQLYNKYRKEHPDDTPAGEFATEPYDDYERLRDRLIECIPDFRLRMKLDPRTDRLVFSADVKSVFDIAWYTLARMLSEEPPLDEKGKPQERPAVTIAGVFLCVMRSTSSIVTDPSVRKLGMLRIRGIFAVEKRLKELSRDSKTSEE